MKVLQFPSFLVLLLSFSPVKSQTSVQDCIGAIPVCQEIYVQNSSFSGVGNIPDEISTGCLADGENNDVWYIFQVSNSGSLNFIISPVNPADDYDWAVYNLTNKSCDDLNDPGVLVSCSFSGTPGVTGPNGFTGQTSAGEFDSPYNNVIPVSQGETYLINISNWSSTNDGYVLNFSNSTANIVDTDLPSLSLITGDYCGSTSLNLSFSERLKCSTIDLSDFSLVGPSGVIPFSLSNDCSTSNFTTELEIILNSSFQEEGSYSLIYSGNISDNCDNIMASFSHDFSIQTLDINSVITNSSCSSNDGGISLSVSNGTPQYTYSWSGGLSNQNVHENLSSGEYTVTVDDSQGCSLSESYLVGFTDPVVAQWNLYEPPSCNSLSDGNLGVQVISGNAPFSFSWSNGDNSSTSNLIQAGSYSVSIESIDGCELTLDTVLKEPDPLELSIQSPSLACVNQQFNILFSISGGTPNYEIDWGNGFETSLSHNIQLNSDSSITAIARDSEGCLSSTETLNISVSTDISLTGGFDTTLCAGDKFGFNIGSSGGNNGPYTYVWNGVAGNSPAYLIDSIFDQTIEVYSKDACNSPSDTLIININTPSKPIFNYLAKDSGACSPLETQLIPIHLESYPLKFQWFVNDQLFSTDSISSIQLLPTGCHDINLLVIDSNNCPFNLEKQCFLEVYPAPNTMFSHNPDTAIFLNPSYTFFNITSGSVSQVWDFGDGTTSNVMNPFHEYSDTGRYNVELTTTNEYGCVNSISKEVLVEFLTLLYVPTAFTPNQDGKNDFFYIQSNGLNYDEFEITIYDRWGHLMFDSNSVEFKWDGTNNGNKLPIGIYTYRIKVLDFKGDKIDKLGSVTLIR